MAPSKRPWKLSPSCWLPAPDTRARLGSRDAPCGDRQQDVERQPPCEAEKIQSRGKGRYFVGTPRNTWEHLPCLAKASRHVFTSNVVHFFPQRLSYGWGHRRKEGAKDLPPSRSHGLGLSVHRVLKWQCPPGPPGLVSPSRAML